MRFFWWGGNSVFSVCSVFSRFQSVLTCGLYSAFPSIRSLSCVDLRETHLIFYYIKAAATTIIQSVLSLHNKKTWTITKSKSILNEILLFFINEAFCNWKSQWRFFLTDGKFHFSIFFDVSVFFFEQIYY